MGGEARHAALLSAKAPAKNAGQREELRRKEGRLGPAQTGPAGHTAALLSFGQVSGVLGSKVPGTRKTKEGPQRIGWAQGWLGCLSASSQASKSKSKQKLSIAPLSAAWFPL